MRMCRRIHITRDRNERVASLAEIGCCLAALMLIGFTMLTIG